MTETGRHRAEPRSRLGFFIVIGTVVAVLWAGIWAFFAFQGGSPQGAAEPVQAFSPSPSSFGPTVQPSPSESLPAPVRVYPAANGDNLWDISRRECGNSSHWHHLADVNHISYPWLVKTGRVLTIDC